MGEREPWSLDRLLAVARQAGIEAVAVGSHYRQPALLVGGKFLARLRDADVLVVRCGLPEKEMLIEAVPETYFETDHYRGWPAVLVRLARADTAEVAARLVAGVQSLRKPSEKADARKTRGRAKGQT